MAAHADCGRTPDFVNHDPAVPESGREGLKQLFAVGLGAMPNLRATVEDMVAEGDKVVVRATFHGTHQGPSRGYPRLARR